MNTHVDALAELRVDKQLNRRRHRQNSASVSSSVLGRASVQQQSLPNVQEKFPPLPSMSRDYPTAPGLTPPAGNTTGSRDYSAAIWVPPLPPPPPSSAFRPYQPGSFNFDKFIPSNAGLAGPESCTAKYVEPRKSFTFPAKSDHEQFILSRTTQTGISKPNDIDSPKSSIRQDSHPLDQVGAAMHPARLALLEQAEEPELDVVSKKEGEAHFPSSSFGSGGPARERTGANMEPLTRKRPSISNDEDSSSKKVASPSRMAKWVVEPNVTPAKFKPAPSILHGYGHSYTVPASFHDSGQYLENEAHYQSPLQTSTFIGESPSTVTVQS